MPNGRDPLVSRAEKFEDEKRRIVESCFMKRDEDGHVLETYITHIRITEYSTHPTAPPPPQARTPQSQKNRIIIIAVRQSGRVRVHKSKENPNGSFSIGKTWVLDDLSSIESFSGSNANSNFREWAGDVGFIVTLVKPYYWQAQTDKEKKFFIASLIKIYTKYTGGRAPNLLGFDDRELEQVMGGATATRRQPPQQRPPTSGTPLSDSATMNTMSSGKDSSMSMYANRPSTSQGALVSASALPERGGNRSPLALNGGISPAQSVGSGRPSQDLPRPRWNALENRSQDSLATSQAARSDDGSLRPRSRNGVNGGPSAYTTPEPPPVASFKTQPPVREERPPERKRPPMDPLRPRTANDDNLVPAPLLSPNIRRGPVAPPPKSIERMSPRKNSPSRHFEPTAALPEPGPVEVQPPEPEPVVPPPQRALTPQALSAPSVSVPSLTASSTPPKELAKIEIPVLDETPDARPGLGPMIKAKKSKDEIAGAFRRYAAAAAAFKPRLGGAGERLRLGPNKSDENDGITGVFAPPKPASKASEAAPESTVTPEPAAKAPNRISGGLPEVQVTPEAGARPSSGSLEPTEQTKTAEEQEPKDQAGRKSVLVGNDVKYLASLGIDPSILDGRSTEFTRWLDHFGFVPGEQMRAKHLDAMRADIERELNQAQAGGWLARFEEEDDRVDAIKRGIDASIKECEELDNLLTLYSVELSTLSDDIAYIEAQGQGLQVQAANQKVLKRELESLLETCAISEQDLEALRIAPLESAGGIEEIERALVTLYKAMLKIDPSMGSGGVRQSEDGNDQAAGLNSDYSNMRIVQEKKEMYLAESTLFMRRLVDFMARQFDDAFRATKTALNDALSRRVDSRNHEAGRDMLWKYSPLILYARDVDLENWNRVLQIYQDRSQPVYRAEFKDAVGVWKQNSRKNTGEENEVLFTSLQEKKEEGIATTARKLTVKRSQTLARTLRSPLGEGNSSRTNMTADKVTSAQALPYVVFSGAVDDLLPLVEMEQNFVIDFFHATTLEVLDFPDAVALARPRDRRGGDLKRHRSMEPDRELARRVTRSMETIFSFLERDLQGFVDHVLGIDALQGIGIIVILEKKMAEFGESNQDFLNTVLQKLHGSMEARLRKFVDEQIRAIEDTKVKIKKRKGVIGFMRVFPHFTKAVENMLIGVDVNLGIRGLVDHEYGRIIKSMFESLQVIARENPAVVMAGGNSADPEGKEALNFHILLIENMNHFLEEVDNPRGLDVLDVWRRAAQQQLGEHLGLYLATMMRRPLGKLLEHLENVEAQLAAGKSSGAVAAQASNSKAVFSKVLGAYDAKEVRKGIEALRKRVEKHFSGEGADEGSLSSGSVKLVNKVLMECERYFSEVEMRIGRAVTDVYGGDVQFEWPRADVRAAFAGTGR